jgi:hypothetical protein
MFAEEVGWVWVGDDDLHRLSADILRELEVFVYGAVGEEGGVVYVDGFVAGLYGEGEGIGAARGASEARWTCGYQDFAVAYQRGRVGGGQRGSVYVYGGSM